jgi:signal transduction histidine kinase/pSer/pThr/pTyr-binding forkhead associated (FHA) protein/ActR/RegA family two-component response regulator
VLQLHGDSTPSAWRTFDVSQDVTLLGRDPDCEIILTARNVSRRHARIVRHQDDYILEDLGSKIGTLINDLWLQDPVRLQDGDLIGIGDSTFTFTLIKASSDGQVDPSTDSAILGVRDVSGSAERARVGIHPQEKLHALLEISRDLGGASELKDVLARTLDALFRIFPQAERGFVLLKKEGAGSPAPRAIKVRGDHAGRVTMSRTVFDYVIHQGQAVLSEDVADARFRSSKSLDDAPSRTLICVPLKNHEREPIGILQLDTRDPSGRFDSEDLDILAAVAGQVSVAVENARLLAEARQERLRLAFLAEAGAALASSLDLPATLNAVARLAVPQLADLCLIDLQGDDGAVHRVAAVHADSGKQAIVDLLRHRYPPNPNGPHPTMRVLHTGRSELANTVPDQLLEATTRDRAYLNIVRRLGLKAYLIVPLVAQGRTKGVLSLIATDAERDYSQADLELAEELARRAALAIDNAALYQAAEASRRRIEEASRSKDVFLAMLSHELRTPLTPILAVVSARLEHGASPVLRPELEMIRRNVALEARLIDDLLDLSRIERGQLRLECELVDVHQVVQQAVEICRDETFEAGLDVKLDFAAPEHTIKGDSARIMQIAWNLIRNAAKFTPAGGTLTIRSQHRRLDDPGTDGGRLIIEFEDTGQGVEPALLSRIFDAFEQGQADLRSRRGGLGLGLAISRSLAEAHGGSLTAQSPGPGLGSTFRLELATVHVPVPHPSAVASEPSQPRSRRCLRLLIVEDNRDTRQFLSLVLSQRGHEVHTAASLSEARAELVGRDFDLLISDIELPDGTGLELMQELAQRGVPGIAMSGFGSEEDVGLSHQSGFAAHLIKPIELRQLEETIRRVTERSMEVEPLLWP